MTRVKRKKTNGNRREYMTRSKKRNELNENDFISSLPLDLLIRILAKLPPSSIPKLVTVSKRWSSIVQGKDLKELFISRSSTRPSLLFTYISNTTIREFHCCSQDDPTSGTHHRTTITPDPILESSPPVRGLICGRSMYNNRATVVICNPSTGQFVTLPRIKTRRRHLVSQVSSFLGYDPVNDLYKVLCMTLRRVGSEPVVSQEHQVFTLGVKRKTWRSVECEHPYCPVTNQLCIDGVIYYGAWSNSYREGSLVMSFHVGSESFGVIKLPDHVKIVDHYQTALVKYHETIALVDHSEPLHVDLWVFQKQEWFKISVLLPHDIIDDNIVFNCMGTIGTGELIFAPSWLTKPYFLLYYQLQGNTYRRVRIEEIEDTFLGPTSVELDHVETPMFLSMYVRSRSD